jgi:hypothetical protein
MHIMIIVFLSKKMYSCILLVAQESTEHREQACWCWETEQTQQQDARSNSTGRCVLASNHTTRKTNYKYNTQDSIKMALRFVQFKFKIQDLGLRREWS